MPSEKVNLTMAKNIGLIFNVVLARHLAYHNMYNSFFMDLPVSSHLIEKSVNLVVARDCWKAQNARAARMGNILL